MRISEYIVPAICLLSIFIMLFLINTFYLEGIPHVPDDAAYLFMAKMFAAGHIVLPIPVSPQHFNFFPEILSVDKGSWLFQYPFGHPLFLSIGILIGNPNIIPPIVGTLVVLCMFLIARTIYNRTTALIVLLLPLLSPFFLENAASFMSHNTASLYLIIAVLLIVLFYNSKEGKNWLLTFSGISFGLVFNTRPLTSLPFIAVAFLILFFKRHQHYNSSFKRLLFFSVGIICLFSVWLFYNKITTGNLLQSQYYLNSSSRLTIPVDYRDILQRFDNIGTLFNSLSPMLFNLPVSITYIFLFIPFIKQKNIFWDNIFLLFIPLLPITYFFYNGTFLMYGPRFWYEMLPFIMLLTARGIFLLSSSYKKMTIIVCVVLFCISVGRLFSLIPIKNPDQMSPLSLKSLQSFNFVDARILNVIKQKNIHNSLVFVDDCSENWWCYGSVFSQNNPFLNTDIIYAKKLDNQSNDVLRKYFSNRKAFEINYYTLSLRRLPQ